MGIFFMLFKWGNFKQRFACSDFDYYNHVTDVLLKSVTLSDCITPIVIRLLSFDNHLELVRIFLVYYQSFGELSKNWCLIQKSVSLYRCLFVLYLCRSCSSNVGCCVSNRSQKKLEEYHHNISRLLFFVLYSTTILPC